MDTTKIPAIIGCLAIAFAVTELPAQEATVTDEAEGSQQLPAADPIVEQVPVAEEDVGDEVVEEMVGPSAEEAGSAPQALDEDSLQEEFEHFKQLFQAGLMDEADTVAKRVIEIAIATKGPRSNEMAKALTNLAIVQHRSRQFEAAQQNYEAAIEIIEENEDRLNEQLVNPLRGLAAAQLESGRPDLATDTYNRAVHVTHVNEGPHNLQQIDLLEDLAEVQLRMGKTDEAKEIQDRIYALTVREYDLDSLAIIPALKRRAEWQHRAGFIYDERASYRRIIRIIEDKDDKNSLELIEPLMALGRSYFYLDTSGQSASYQAAVGVSSGEIYFKRGLRIALENPNATWQILAFATLNLGDYYMYEGNAPHARQIYHDAWVLLSEPQGDNDKLQMRHDQLESLVPLRLRSIPGFVGDSDPTMTPPPSDDPVMQGTITVSYDVSSRGRAENLKLVEADPPEFASMQQAVQREIRSRIYRPMFVDGDAADTTNLVYVHSYYYKKSDLDAARASGEAGIDAGEETDTEDESG